MAAYSFLLALLLDCIAEGLGAGLVGAVHEVGRNGSLGHAWRCFLLALLLLVHLESLLELHLLVEALLGVQLGPEWRNQLISNTKVTTCRAYLMPRSFWA